MNVFRRNTTGYRYFELVRIRAPAAQGRIYVNTILHTANGIDVTFLHRRIVYSDIKRSCCRYVDARHVLTGVKMKIRVRSTRLESFLKDDVRASTITAK